MDKTGFVPNIFRANMIHICVLQGAMVSTDSRCAYTDNCRCIVYSDKRNSAAGKSFSLMSCSALGLANIASCVPPWPLHTQVVKWVLVRLWEADASKDPRETP